MQRRSISINARNALQLGSISGTTGAVPHNNRLQRTGATMVAEKNARGWIVSFACLTCPGGLAWISRMSSVRTINCAP